MEVTVANEGRDAVEQARSTNPDVLVLDWMLPGMDGLEVLSKDPAPSIQKVPALFLTAKDSDENRIEGLTAGRNDYLTKPFAMEEL